MREEILTLLEKNCKLTPEEIGAMIGAEADSVASEIQKMEEEKIISGYQALINWDKVESEKVCALIGVKISPMRGEGFDRISTRISNFEEVKSVYLLSGSSNDLMLTIEGDSLKDIAHFVYSKIAPMDTVVSTATYFVLKKYKEHHVSFTGQREDDERIQMTP